MSIDTGYVFIDREFVPAPYVIREAEGGLFINDRPVARQPFERRDRRSGFGGGPGRDEPRRGGPPPAFGVQERPARPPGPGWGRPGMGGAAPWEDRGSRWLAQQLRNDDVAFASADKPMLILDSVASVYLFKSLTSHGTDSESVESVLSALPPQEDRSEWTDWLANYAMPDSLGTRAAALLQKVDQAEAKNLAAAAAVKRLNTLTYPLNVFGMVLSVLALGHLLRSLPKPVDESIPNQRLDELRRAAAVSIGLVAILSGLDLTWTILSSQAGQIIELNPLGSQLVHDPASLAVFKVSATLISCGLLFALRGHARAQTASWWLCLICTVLTFRWLVLNSMFVA